MIMRTRMAAVPPGEDRERSDPPPEPCPATFDGSLEKRCYLHAGHAGLHRWRSSDSSQKFTWG
jgi:hypothetical protein